MKRPNRVRLYAVVEVWRGMADDATVFTSLRQAQIFARAAKRRRSPLEDDVQLFECVLPRASAVRRASRAVRRRLAPLARETS